jgi:hypothetical protein
MDQESVEQMPTDRARQMLSPVAWGDQYVIRAKFQEAGVFITVDWVVLIIGQGLLHCVSVLCGWLQLIEEVLTTHATISLVTVLDKPSIPLYGYLARQAKLLTAKKVAVHLAVLLLGALIGAVVNNWIWPLFSGG